MSQVIQGAEEMVAEKYRSTLGVSTSKFSAFKKRADELHMDALQLARLIVVLALENNMDRSLLTCEDPPGMKTPLGISMDYEIVKELGGREQARNAIKWAVYEGYKHIGLAID